MGIRLLSFFAPKVGSFFLPLRNMCVSENSGTPKSSILIGVFDYKPSILGYPYFWSL